MTNEAVKECLSFTMYNGGPEVDSDTWQLAPNWALHCEADAVWQADGD